jgi:hypothetical protein
MFNADSRLFIHLGIHGSGSGQVHQLPLQHVFQHLLVIIFKGPNHRVVLYIIQIVSIILVTREV